jgi:hypothetical protein
VPRRTAAKSSVPGKCDELDMQILSLVESNPAATNVWIGEKLGIDRETVSRRRARPEYVALYRERNLPARQIIENARTLAAKVLVAALGGNLGTREKPVPVDADDRIKAAVKILGPELLGEEPGEGPAPGQGVHLSGDAASGLLEYFARFDRRSAADGGPRAA